MKIQHRLLQLVAHYLVVIAAAMVFALLIKHVDILRQVDDFLFNILFATTTGDIRGFITHLFDHSFNELPLTIPTFYFFFIGIPVIYLFIKKRSKDAYALFLLYLTCWALAALVFWMDWHVLERERPLSIFTDLPDIFGIRGWQHLPSHPSGHAAGTAIIGTLVTYFIPGLKWPSVVVVLAAALSRVYLGAHFPLDVLAGIVVGYYIGLLGIKIYESRQVLLKR